MIPDFEHMADLDEATHTYTSLSDPDLRLCSVTQMIKSFSRPFDEDTKAAEYARKHRIKKAEVLAQWAEKRGDASVLGTDVHQFAEHYGRDLRRDGFSDRRPDSGTRAAGYIEGVVGFYRDHTEAILAGPQPEIRIVHPAYRIAGTIDLVTCLDGASFILDWKTSEQIDMFGYGEYMYAPFNKLPDSNFWHYALQLSTYKLILKEVYHYEVDSLAIIWLKPHGSYEIKPVKDLTGLVEKGLKRHLKKLEKNDVER